MVTTIETTQQKNIIETSTINKALWFSRHAPTSAQLAEIQEMGYELVEIERGKRLGMIDLTEHEHVNEILNELYVLQDETQAKAVFGVFPTPLLHVMHSLSKDQPYEAYNLICYAAWNVMRNIEGQKPTFQHKCWQEIGYL